MKIKFILKFLALLFFTGLTTEMAAQVETTSTNGEKFQLNGERWTYKDGDFQMAGILLKPDGKGPFPAILISHGLGGSAENFALNKAREFVKWGMVCIAPSYTHSAGAIGFRPGAKGKSPPTAKTGGTSQPANYGASEENLRRARVCLEILRAQSGVDPKRIVAYGHSMGGFVTIGLAASATNLLKAAAITGSGIAPRSGFPAPSTDAAEKIRTPFLILHGGSDPVVRPEQSASLKAVLDRNQVPNDRRIFEGVGHPVDQEKRSEVLALIHDWFAKYDVIRPVPK